jgi:hypothetical protein
MHKCLFLAPAGHIALTRYKVHTNLIRKVPEKWKREREDPQQGKILIYCISGTWNLGSCTTGLILLLSHFRHQKPENIKTLVLIFWLKLLPA